MKASEIMTKDPACVTPEDSARQAAQLMADNDCGCLPVVESHGSGRIVGVITDRDIAVRGVARGRNPDTAVRDLMTREATTCPPEADLEEVERAMSDRQVRRIVVADADGRACGIISQADLARASDRDVSEKVVARVVERISEPARASTVGDRSSSAAPRA
jgi:CBS domain-containing protein